MKTAQKINYLNMTSKAYLTGYGITAGLYLKDIEYGIDDHAIISFEPWGYNYTSDPHYGKSVHRLKINYDTKKPYINFLGYRIKLDHFIRL